MSLPLHRRQVRPWSFHRASAPRLRGHLFSLKRRDIRLLVANAVQLRGNLAFTRLENRFVIAAENVQAVLGTEDAGVVIRDAGLRLVVYTAGPRQSTFALEGEGSVSLRGLPGLNIDGEIAMRLNSSNLPVSEQITVGGQTIQINLPANTSEFRGAISFSVPNVFRLAGTVSLRRLLNGELYVSVDDADLKIFNSAGEEQFAIGGRASFRLGGISGFRLQDFRMNQVAMFGTSFDLPPGQPLPDPGPGFGNQPGATEQRRTTDGAHHQSSRRSGLGSGNARQSEIHRRTVRVAQRRTHRYLDDRWRRVGAWRDGGAKRPHRRQSTARQTL